MSVSNNALIDLMCCLNRLEADLDVRAEISAATAANNHPLLVCRAPEIQRAVEFLGYDLLIDTLDLDDTTFISVYQNQQWERSKRQKFKKVVESHIQACEHCQMTVQRDEWVIDAVDGILIHNKQAVAEMLNFYMQNCSAPQKNNSTTTLTAFATQQQNTSHVFAALAVYLKNRRTRIFANRSGRKHCIRFAAIILTSLICLAAYNLWLERPTDHLTHQSKISSNGNKVTENKLSSDGNQIAEPMSPIQSPNKKGTSYTPLRRTPKQDTSNDSAAGELIASVPEVDLDEHSEIRGEEEADPARSKTITVCAQTKMPTKLLLRLPERSVSGEYNMAILDSTSTKPITEKKFRSHDGVSLSVVLDLKQLPEGQYYLELFRDHEAPRFYSLTVKRGCS